MIVDAHQHFWDPARGDYGWLKPGNAIHRIFAPADWNEVTSGLIDRLHAAITAHQVLRLDYRDETGRGSEREIEPLCLAFWGGAWTLGSGCRLRADFRSFRPDRIAAFDPTGEIFVEVPGRDVAAYVRAMGGGDGAA